MEENYSSMASLGLVHTGVHCVGAVQCDITMYHIFFSLVLDFIESQNDTSFKMNMV